MLERLFMHIVLRLGPRWTWIIGKTKTMQNATMMMSTTPKLISRDVHDFAESGGLLESLGLEPVRSLRLRSRSRGSSSGMARCRVWREQAHPPPA
jgi:hypothetical protein